MIQPLLGGFLGLALGMRHALEPDHLAAVTTLATEEHSPRGGARLGALWGVGHTAALLSVGFALAVLRAELPDALADVFEFGVALMLFGLGLRAIRRGAPEHHVHRGPSDHVHLGRWTLMWRPLVVGIVHGLAGSGALTAWVLAEMPTVELRLLYIAFFGLGSVLGMAMLSGFAGWQLARIRASPRAQRVLSVSMGGISAALGIFWGYPFVVRWISGEA